VAFEPAIADADLLFRDHAGHEADFVIPEADGVRLSDAKLSTNLEHRALDPAEKFTGEKVLEKVLITPDSGDLAPLAASAKAG